MVHVRTLQNAAELTSAPAAAAAAADVGTDAAPTFGHSGVLWHNSYLLYDRETESLWHHLTGRAMSGPLRGARMRRLPVSILSFGAWRAEHPGTLVLPRPANDTSVVGAPGPVPTGADLYAERNATIRLGFGVDAPDGFDGVDGVGSSILVPLDELHAGPLETEIPGVGGPLPVVVVATDRRAAAAFDRRVRGRTLSFDGDMTKDGRPLLRERGGSAAWFARTGLPVPGTGAEAPLSLLPGSLWETTAWRLQHPGAPVRTRARPR